MKLTKNQFIAAYKTFYGESPFPTHDKQSLADLFRDFTESLKRGYIKTPQEYFETLEEGEEGYLFI
jgi:hypothetical protein